MNGTPVAVPAAWKMPSTRPAASSLFPGRAWNTALVISICSVPHSLRRPLAAHGNIMSPPGYSSASPSLTSRSSGAGAVVIHVEILQSAEASQMPLRCRDVRIPRIGSRCRFSTAGRLQAQVQTQGLVDGGHYRRRQDTHLRPDAFDRHPPRCRHRVPRSSADAPRTGCALRTTSAGLHLRREVPVPGANRGYVAISRP